MNRMRFAAFFAIVSTACLSLPFQIALACGFHSAFLGKNVTPREWWEYHKHEYVEESAATPAQQVSGAKSAEPEFFRSQKSGTPEEKKTRQKALIAMVLNHLLYLNATNIVPYEFPDFNSKVIPEFNRDFKGMLVELGAEAVPFILDAYLDTMRSDYEDIAGLKRNSEFNADLVEVLLGIGNSSIAAIAEKASKTPGKRERDAMLGLVSKIVQPDPALRGIPAILKAAIERWPENGRRLLSSAAEWPDSGPARRVLMDSWLGISFDRSGTAEILTFLKDRTASEELRVRAVGFLSDRGQAAAVPEFLSIAIERTEALYVRRECIAGIWRTKILNPDAPVTAVLRSSGLKDLITDVEAPKVLRVYSVFLLARLKDREMMDALMVVLHREEEDEGMRMAAIEAVRQLGMQVQAAARIEPGLLARRGHIAAVRFGLLEIVSSSSDRRIAPVLVKMALSRDEYPPVRLKAFSVIHSLQMPGFAQAADMILARSDLVESLASFVFDSSVSFSERSGVIEDLERLASLQVRGPVSALFSTGKAEETMRKGGLTDDILGPMADLFLRYKGSDALPFVAAILDDPDARPVVLVKSALWAGKWMVAELAEPMKKAFERSKDPTFRLAAALALAGLGEKKSPSEIAVLMLPKSEPAPEMDVFVEGLALLSRRGDRESLANLARFVKPAQEGDFPRAIAALRALAGKGPDARPWFQPVWTAFRKSELGNAEARTVFLDCMTRMGPSQAICDNLLKQAAIEMQRLPFSLPGGAWDQGGESLENARRIIPPLHALALLNAYMTRSTELFDLARTQDVHQRIMTWQMSARRNFPKD